MSNKAINLMSPEDVKIEKLKSVILLLLDQVDYTQGACKPNEMVGACLDKSVIKIARDSLKVG